MIRNREHALEIIKALPDEVREAIAVFIESAVVETIEAGTNEEGGSIFEDDGQTTLNQVALEIRGRKKQ